MRRSPSCLFVLLALMFAGTQAMAAPPSAPVLHRHFSEAQKADLKRISDYLNGLQSVKGDFVQMDPDGTMVHGVFYLQKPGRVRFEYRPPNPNLIIADGSTLAVENSKLKTVDHYPLIGSPLALLLSTNIDLTVNSHVVDVQHQPGNLTVSASAASGATRSDITFTFSDPGIELRQWEIIDSQGLKTTVVLNDLQSGVDIPPDLFVIHEPPWLKKSEN
jgi:outer membrane lipoprotein-sorting protein